MKKLKIENCRVLSEYGNAHYQYNDNKYTNTFLALEEKKNAIRQCLHLFVWDESKKSLVSVDSVTKSLIYGKYDSDDFRVLHKVLQDSYIDSPQYQLNDVEIAENGDFDFAGDEYYVHLGSDMA